MKIRWNYMPQWKHMINSFWRKYKSWFTINLMRLFRYVVGTAKLATMNDIRVLYHSENFLVVDKPFDVVINSNDPLVKVTVEHQLRKIFPNLASDNLTHGFHFAHRLDYPTSGVLCIACNKISAAKASHAFSNRKTKKYYLALLRGHVSHELIDISIPIGGDSRPDFSRRMCSTDKNYCRNPRSASTRLVVLQTGVFDGFPVTKVMLKPLTGRRHQLRVHCSSLGHTIVGDFTYSNGQDNLPYRMFLHAHRLILPTSLESFDICAGDPFDVDNSANRLWSPEVTVNDYKKAYEKLDQFSPVKIVTVCADDLR